MKSKISNKIIVPKFDYIVIDGRNQVFKYQHTMKYLRTRSGVETGIYHGFMCLVLKLKQDNINSKVIIAWEGGDLVRRKQLSTYKNGRPKVADSFESKIKNLKDMLGMLGVIQKFVPGYEADDIAAIITKKYPDKKVLLVSEDRDWYQAMNINTYIMRTNKIYSYQEIKEIEDIIPERYGLYVVLTGKKGNNVKGIPSFPKKLAKRIVDESSSIKEVINYKKIKDEPVNDKWIDLIKSSKKELKEKYEIIRLRNNVKMEAVKCQEKNITQLRKQLKKLEMFKVLNMMKMVRRLKK